METSSAQPKARPGARQLARRAMTAQVAEMAIEFFTERGYDGTTIDDICEVAGISRSTFFRYFPTKEDVLLRDYVDMDDSLLVALMARPDEETPWVAIRRALDPLIDQYSANPERTLRSAKLFIKTPTLVTFHREKLARWGQFLRPELARRLGADPDDPTDPRATALITAALACLDATLAAWATADGVPHLAQLLDRAMNAITA